MGRGISREGRIGIGVGVLGLAGAVGFPAGAYLGWVHFSREQVVGIFLFSIVLGLIGLVVTLHALFWPSKRAIPEAPLPTLAENKLDLAVDVVQVRWRDYQHEALILEAQLRITNNSSASKQFDGFGLQFPTGGQSPKRGDPLLSQFLESREKQYHLLKAHSEIEPGDSISGWIVNAVPRPASGTPGIELIVYDEVRNEYRRSVPAEPGRVFSNGAAPLQPRYEQREPYRLPFPGSRFEHWVGIYNASGNPAITRVQLQIVGMNPVPKTAQGDSPEFPAAVPRRAGDPRSGVTLYPDMEDRWHIATTYPDGQGAFYVQGIAMPAWPLGRNEMWPFKRGEQWRLHFQASADSLPSRPFDVVMDAVGDAIRCQLERV